MIGILPILALHVEVTVRRGIRYLNRRFQVGGPQVSSSPGLLTRNLKVCMFKLPTRTLPAHHWQLPVLRVPVIMPCSVDDAAPGLRLGPGVRVPVVTAEGRWPGVATWHSNPDAARTLRLAAGGASGSGLVMICHSLLLSLEASRRPGLSPGVSLGQLRVVTQLLTECTAES